MYLLLKKSKGLVTMASNHFRNKALLPLVCCIDTPGLGPTRCYIRHNCPSVSSLGAVNDKILFSEFLTCNICKCMFIYVVFMCLLVNAQA